MSMSFALKRNSVRQKSGLGGPEGLPPLSTTSFPASSYWAQIPDPYEGAIEREASQSGNPDLARSSVQTSDRLAQPSLARLSRKSFGSNSSYALGGPPRGQSATMSSSYGRSSLAAAHTSFLLRSSLVPSSHAGGYKSVRSSVRQSQRIREEGDGAQSSSSIEMATHDPQAPPPPTGQDPSFSLDQHQESSRRSTAPSALGSQSEGSGSKQSPRFATHASKRRAELLKTPISSDEEDEGKI